MTMLEAIMSARGRGGEPIGETRESPLMDAVKALLGALEAIRRGEDAGADAEVWHDADAVYIEAELPEGAGGAIDLCVHRGRVHIRLGR